MIFETIQMAFKVADDGHMLAKKKKWSKKKSSGDIVEFKRI